jgi:hypothetical protein
MGKMLDKSPFFRYFLIKTDRQGPCPTKGGIYRRRIVLGRSKREKSSVKLGSIEFI